MIDRIVINENDLTTPYSGFTFTDTVFIPGFADPELATVDAGIPTRCENITQFHNAFGATAPRFAENQTYELITYTPAGEASTPGFAAAAIPVEDSDQGAIFAEANAPDPSYVLAEYVIRLGLPVIYLRLNENRAQITVPDFYAALDAWLGRSAGEGEALEYDLRDTNEYDIKFLTTGGYPAFEFLNASGSQSIALSLIDIAAGRQNDDSKNGRGDCVVLIDHTNNPERKLTGVTSVYGTSQTRNSYLTALTSSWAAMFTPWCECAGMVMPASFVYLGSFANASKANPNWLAVAGTARGYNASITRLLTDAPLTNTIADFYQVPETGSGISINAITKINPTGYCIWGNRTLAQRSSNAPFATTLLNVRNMISDIKKQARIAALQCMFEQNTDILWVNFKSMITPLLDKMRTGTGLKNYKIIKKPTMEKQKVVAEIRIQPYYSVEAFKIDVVITDEDVEVTSSEA